MFVSIYLDDEDNLDNGVDESDSGDADIDRCANSEGIYFIIYRYIKGEWGRGTQKLWVLHSSLGTSFKFDWFGLKFWTLLF